MDISSCLNSKAGADVQDFESIVSPNYFLHSNSIDSVDRNRSGCRRLGIGVKNKDGEYVVLTGNQTGALIFDYLLKEKKSKHTLSKNGVVLKTIVTSEIGRRIAMNMA